MAEIFAYRCGQCGGIQYPKPFVCKHCNGMTFTPEPLEGTGVLLTWTRVHSLPVGFSQSSRTFGIVRFANGVTVTGVLGFDEITLGMQVRSAVEPVRGTGETARQGFVFYPVTP